MYILSSDNCVRSWRSGKMISGLCLNETFKYTISSDWERDLLTSIFESSTSCNINDRRLIKSEIDGDDIRGRYVKSIDITWAGSISVIIHFRKWSRICQFINNDVKYENTSENFS